MSEKEIWKDIKDFPGIYQVSNFGRIKSIERETNIGDGKKRTVRERIRKIHFSESNGYWVVTLKNSGLKLHKRYTVHRLVAIAFIPNPENKPEVNHIDSNKLNSLVTNLEWVTGSENQYHSYKTNNRIGYWTGRESPHKAIPVIAIQETSIIEFKNASLCSQYFDVCVNTILRRVDKNIIIKGHLIYSA